MPGYAPYAGPREFYQEGRTTVDLDSADGFIVVNDAGNIFTLPTAAALATEIVSSDAVDASAGTGAQTVRVAGLDANFEYVEQDATMNGATSVDLATPLRRVLSMRVLTAGSGNQNAGAIDVRLAADTVVARMLIGNNYTSLGFFTVPEGTNMRLLRFGGRLNAVDAVTPAISVRLMIRRDAGAIAEIKATLGQEGALEQQRIEQTFKNYVLPGRTDIYLMVDTDTDDTLFHGFLELEAVR